MKIVVCIPARYASTRFPEKVLAKDTGKFLIQHTYEQAKKAKLPQRVIIAADDVRIVEAARTFGGECVLTSVEHKSGTDRIAEATANVDADIVINVQGDEPEINPDHIDSLARLLIDNPECPMATLVAPFASADQVANPNIVKVVLGMHIEEIHQVGWQRQAQLADGSSACEGAIGKLALAAATQSDARQPAQARAARAIYFSRSPIPYDRDKAGIGAAEQYWRHIGIYAYRKDFLLKITKLPQTPLEKLEKLEQLRALENGFAILVGKVDRTRDGIDTPEQYAAFVERHKAMD